MLHVTRLASETGVPCTNAGAADRAPDEGRWRKRRAIVLK
jgi:hypothetical protein